MADSAGGVDEAVMGLSCVGEYGSAVGVEGGGNETDDGDCGGDVTGRTCTAGTRRSAAASCAISYAGSGSWRRGGVRENSWGRECTPEPTDGYKDGRRTELQTYSSFCRPWRSSLGVGPPNCARCFAEGVPLWKPYALKWQSVARGCMV